MRKFDVGHECACHSDRPVPSGSGRDFLPLERIFPPKTNVTTRSYRVLVRETMSDLDRLQALLDEGRRDAGPHLRRAFGTAESSATDVVAALDGIFEMHLAVVTAAGAPLVAPVDAVLFHGQLWFGLPGAAVRARLVRADPRVSASYAKGDTAIIVHGQARELDEQSALAAEWDELTTELYVAQYGEQFLEWRDAQRRAEVPGAGFTGWIEPRRIFAKT